MARRFACLVTALALLVPINIGAAQTPQLPKTVSLSVVEKDPMPHKLNYKGSAETWNVEQSENDANNPAAVAGIKDVRSGSEDVSPLDGSKYAEW